MEITGIFTVYSTATAFSDIVADISDPCPTDPTTAVHQYAASHTPDQTVIFGETAEKI